MKKLLCSRFEGVNSSTRVSIGLLALRVIAGYGFVLHGSGKITNPFGWMPPEAPVPGIFQALAAIAEFGGGIAWLLGLLTPISSFGILCTMTVAALTHISRGDPFVKGYELAAVYWAVALCLMLIGPGRFSLDFLLNKRCGKGSSPR